MTVGTGVTGLVGFEVWVGLWLGVVVEGIFDVGVGLRFGVCK